MSTDKMTATRSKNVAQAPPQDEDMYTSDWMLYPPILEEKKVLIYIPFHLQSQSSNGWVAIFFSMVNKLWVLTWENFVLQRRQKGRVLDGMHIIVSLLNRSWTYFGPFPWLFNGQIAGTQVETNWTFQISEHVCNSCGLWCLRKLRVAVDNGENDESGIESSYSVSAS